MTIRKVPLVASPHAHEAAVNSESGHEGPAASDQVGGPAAEQQEAAEADRVRGHHPLQVRLGEVELGADRRQRHVHDQHVDHGHEDRHGQEREGPPSVRDAGRHSRFFSGVVPAFH
ncbi:hypothetical protein ABIA35_008989 [Catenulispora sp. MAP12-49]